jgi:single-stranded-DNA-specific exonuclease
MAVGVAAVKDNLESFRLKFAEAIRAHLGSEVAELELDLSVWLDAGDVTDKLMTEIESLHPFGQGNAEPIFGVRGVRFKTRSLSVFKDLHFRFSFEVDSERRLHGVAWKMADRLPPVNTDLDLAVKLAWNHFNGRKLLQMELIDWRLACQR